MAQKAIVDNPFAEQALSFEQPHGKPFVVERGRMEAETFHEDLRIVRRFFRNAPLLPDILISLQRPDGWVQGAGKHDLPAALSRTLFCRLRADTGAHGHTQTKEPPAHTGSSFLRERMRFRFLYAL